MTTTLAPASEAAPPTPPERHAGLGVLLGIVCGAVAIAVAQLVAGIVDPDASPIVAVGQAAIDATPEWLKSFAIRTFGSNDKKVLLSGIFLVLAVISVALGIVSRRRRWVGFAGIGGLTLVGTAAAMSRPTATVSWAVPAIVAGAVAAGAYVLLLRPLRPPVPEERSMDGPTPDRPATPAGFDRRRFLVTAAALGATAVAAGGASRYVGRSAQAAADRSSLMIPPASSPAAPLAAGADLDVEGISPFLTPVDHFYRVDTALLVPRLRLQDWRLSIGGMVDRPTTLAFQDLIARDLIERDITLNCVSNPVGGRYIGTARWIGVPLKPLLEEAGVQAGATQIASRSVDGFTVGTPLSQALDGRDSMLAIAMDGAPLPFEHGFPVRMLVPGLYGYESATKWISSIELVDDSFQAYWVKRGWARAVDVKTASRIDTPSNGARLAAGAVEMAGVAWAQHRGIRGVQLRIDGGAWIDVELATEDTTDTWRQWRYRWEAPAGQHTLEVRAIDATGAVQTSTEAPPFPSGATGHDTIAIEVD